MYICSNIESYIPGSLYSHPCDKSDGLLSSLSDGVHKMVMVISHALHFVGYFSSPFVIDSPSNLRQNQTFNPT